MLSKVLNATVRFFWELGWLGFGGVWGFGVCLGCGVFGLGWCVFGLF